MILKLPPNALPAGIRQKINLFDNTLRRLLRGDFDDLPDADRHERGLMVIGLCADAATALAAMPVPFLELPVHAAMVGAIGKIHGHAPFDKKGLKRIMASIGGGVALRQLTRLAPFGGQIPYAVRVHGTTWTLGLAAQNYFERRGGPADLPADGHPVPQSSAPGPAFRSSQNEPDINSSSGAKRR